MKNGGTINDMIFSGKFNGTYRKLGRNINQN